LICASRNGNEGVVSRLISSGADANTKDNYGRTALMRASNNGRKGIVSMLLMAMKPCIWSNCFDIYIYICERE